MPEDVIVQIGEAYFRLCRSPAAGTSPAERRVLRFFYNPRQIQGLHFDASMSGFKVDTFGPYFGTWKDFVADWLKRRVKTTEYASGGIRYQGYTYFDQLPQSLIGPEVFFHAGDDDGKKGVIPTHSVTCTPDIGVITEGFSRCHITVGFGGVRGNGLLFGGGEVPEEIPMEKLPWIAADLWKIMSVANVTDRLVELNHLPMRRQHYVVTERPVISKGPTARGT